MSKIFEIGITAALFLVILAGYVPRAAAQQNGFLCPLAPMTGRILVLFDSASPIVAHQTLSAATAGPIAAALPTGMYDITMAAYDAHSTRQPTQNQKSEQFYLRLSNGQTTNRVSDLPEDSDSIIEQIDSNFVVTSDVTSLVAQHAEYPNPGEPNSIIPICVAFDTLTPTPTPTPTPTLTPTPTPQISQSQSGSAEADCCPGPDLESESSPTSAPRVAGFQSMTSSLPETSLEPTIAGAFTNFPTAGFPLKAIAGLVVLLLIALIVWPTGDKQLET